jgi:excisionase family DNA binding protein
MNPPAPEWLSLQQAAVIYGVSVDTLRRRISDVKLPASRFGVRLIRVPGPGELDPSAPLG